MRSAGGRPVAVEITTPLPYLEVGFRFRVLGDELGDGGFGFTSQPTGRPPLPEDAPTRKAQHRQQTAIPASTAAASCARSIR